MLLVAGRVLDIEEHDDKIEVSRYCSRQFTVRRCRLEIAGWMVTACMTGRVKKGRTPVVLKGRTMHCGVWVGSLYYRNTDKPHPCCFFQLCLLSMIYAASESEICHASTFSTSD